MKRGIRSWRAFWYRRLPRWGKNFHTKRLAGFERRWDLEGKGFTTEGFFEIFQKRLLRGLRPGRFVELAAGDGLVGSLGLWLEAADPGWRVEAWEHRPVPERSIRRHRPQTVVHGGRLTGWPRQEAETNPAGITTRGVREAAGVCRAIRQGLIRPAFLGIWNPTRRSLWERRLRREGYRLEMVHHRMEFYRSRRAGDGCRKAVSR